MSARNTAVAKSQQLTSSPVSLDSHRRHPQFPSSRMARSFRRTQSPPSPFSSKARRVFHRGRATIAALCPVPSAASARSLVSRRREALSAYRVGSSPKHQQPLLSAGTAPGASSLQPSRASATRIVSNHSFSKI
ncbi:hypothetical protein AAHA92_12688 [Salvia divinorum]|uniref:Uncharacterized protein n=1 Tax=Salvia divinorum TaxID=28513 RepID=A0ABD1HL51_SALDI